MKNVWKYILITLAGIAAVGTLFCFMMAIVCMMLFPKVNVGKNSVMLIELDGSLADRGSSDPLGEILGSASNTTGLDDVFSAIRLAKMNHNVRGIYIRCRTFTGAAPAMLQELRDVLEDFKETGKFIVAYADNYTQGAYYVCSVADSLIVNPSGMIELNGLSSTTMYYTHLLEKVGVNMQVFKVGTYKSAVEPYMLDSMSVANRDQTTVFTSEIWDEMLADIRESRKINKSRLDELVEEGLMFKPATYYKKNHIVDKTAYIDEMPGIISRMIGSGDEGYNEVGMYDILTTAQPATSDVPNQIAVYYATGNIIHDQVSSLYSESQIIGSQVVEDLKSLAEDDNIKAVVLRVNSPGGSAYAAEQIWHQVMNIKAKKPIVVSMGGYAASGGYYISCAADWIVAEPTTITGSIGIFGMIPDAGELLEDKLGLHFSTVKTNEYSDFGSLYRQMNDGESRLLQGYVNRGYELFTQRCADGRDIPQDSIKVIGEGRVWTGLHARQLGLVDQLGGLQDAVSVAKKRANLKHCYVVEYPMKTDVWGNLLGRMLGMGQIDYELRNSLGEFYSVLRSVKDLDSRDYIQTAMPYIIKFNL